MGRKQVKLVKFYEVGRNWADRSTRPVDLFFTEAWHHSAGHWRRSTSNRESACIFPFSALQTLGNLADHVLTSLAI